jgi:hypothetical protein
MSQPHHHEESLLLNVIIGLVKAVCQIFKMILLAVFSVLQYPLSRALPLEKWASSWKPMKWLYLPVRWLSVCLFANLLISGLLELSNLTPQAHAAHILTGLLQLAISQAFGLLWNILYGLQKIAESPAFCKQQAGRDAEHYVRQLITDGQCHFPHSLALHGTLFVFQADTPDEFSVEADHLLVTTRTIFVIETKYKSGAITARADLPTWTVNSPHGTTTMANALHQVKNAARVLQREAGLPGEPIPLVAIHGNHTQIVDGPTNVLAAPQLIAVMQAFEHTAQGAALDPARVMASLKPYIRDDAAAMARHIERAEAARRRAAMREIVSAASLQ